jgi:hypothetical protein
MMSTLCNCWVRELLILARTWFAFSCLLKPGVTPAHAILTSRRGSPTLANARRFRGVS